MSLEIEMIVGLKEIDRIQGLNKDQRKTIQNNKVIVTDMTDSTMNNDLLSTLITEIKGIEINIRIIVAEIIIAMISTGIDPRFN